MKPFSLREKMTASTTHLGSDKGLSLKYSLEENLAVPLSPLCSSVPGVDVGAELLQLGEDHEVGRGLVLHLPPSPPVRHGEGHGSQEQAMDQNINIPEK